MSIITNIPEAMLTEHVNWHTRPGNPAGGGRQINPWPPVGGGPAGGSGEEFLVWHRGYLARFHQWVQSLPQTDRPDPASIAPWQAIPQGLKMGMVGWTAARAQDEQRLANMSNFSSLDEVGRFIEWGLHGFLHSGSSAMWNEPVLLSFRSPRSTFFWQLHGLVDHWREQWEVAQQDQPGASPFAPLEVDGAAVQGAIATGGEVDLYAFFAGAAGDYTIETLGATDTVLYLAGPDNSTALLAVNDDSDGNWNARITRSLPVGAYFLYVTHYSATGTGAYEIRVRTGA
jgi:hypothetical protein